MTTLSVCCCLHAQAAQLRRLAAVHASNGQQPRQVWPVRAGALCTILTDSNASTTPVLAAACRTRCSGGRRRSSNRTSTSSAVLHRPPPHAPRASLPLLPTHGAPGHVQQDGQPTRQRGAALFAKAAERGEHETAALRSPNACVPRPAHRCASREREREAPFEVVQCRGLVQHPELHAAACTASSSRRGPCGEATAQSCLHARAHDERERPLPESTPQIWWKRRVSDDAAAPPRWITRTPRRASSLTRSRARSSKPEALRRSTSSNTRPTCPAPCSRRSRPAPRAARFCSARTCSSACRTT